MDTKKLKQGSDYLKSLGPDANIADAIAKFNEIIGGENVLTDYLKAMQAKAEQLTNALNTLRK